MDSATGEAPVRRRRARGRKQPSTPAAVGTALLRARQQLGLGLVDVRDRTGVPVPVLEALEAGDLAAVNLETAAIGLRRYADLVGLDGEGLCRSLRLVPEGTLVGAGAGAGAGGRAGAASAPAPPFTVAPAGHPPGTEGFAGHLRRYPGDGTHLQAFTQTAQVPSVGGAPAAGAWSAGGHDSYGSDQLHGSTGMYPSTPPLRIRQRVRPAARPVRWLVWLTGVLLVVASAGLVVAHVKPSWMRTLHLVRVPHRVVPHAASGTGVSGTGAGTHQASGQGTGSAVVTTGAPGPAGTTVTVRAGQYTVVLDTLAPCWVMATTPQASTPALNTTLPAGTKQVLTPVDGQLTVEVGAAGVVVTVQIGGKTVPGWSFTPPDAPMTLVFTNTPSSTTP